MSFSDSSDDDNSSVPYLPELKIEQPTVPSFSTTEYDFIKVANTKKIKEPEEPTAVEPKLKKGSTLDDSDIKPQQKVKANTLDLDSDNNSDSDTDSASSSSKKSTGSVKSSKSNKSSKSSKSNSSGNSRSSKNSKKDQNNSEDASPDSPSNSISSFRKLDNIPLVPRFDINEPSLIQGNDNNMNESQLKLKYLYKIEEYNLDGWTFKKQYDERSSIEELKFEVNRIEEKIKKRNLKDKQSDTVEWEKETFVYSVTILEWVNKTFNSKLPLKLDGWSDQVKFDVENDKYTDIFKDLQEKYQPVNEETGKSSTPPEIRLIGMICFSAFMFHITSSMAPGMASAFRNQSPSVVKKKKDKRSDKKSSKMKGPSDYSRFERQINEQFA